MQMLLADAVERTVQATLEQRENAFNRIGRNVAAHVFFTALWLTK